MQPGQRRLSVDGEAVAIGSRAIDLLILLTSRPGSTFSPAEITAAVWGKPFVDEANLRAQVATLRRVLGDDQRDPKYVANVPGRGYCFIASVELASDQRLEHNRPTPVMTQPARVMSSSIFGRDDVIEDICAQLRSSRLLTIVGPGGIGKSTVAKAAIARSEQLYGSIAVTVELAAVSNSALVATAIASALNYVPRSGNLAAEICSYLKDTDRLIFIDSCEHLIDAVAALIEQICNEAPTVTILATSREPLRISGERVHRLGGLGFPAETVGRDSTEAMRYPAVELFVERARACLGHYELRDDEAAGVSEICRRLDGIALAIELAAGRLETIGVAKLASSLDDCFRVLTHGRRTALPRHQTLRATLDWSYNILHPRDQFALQAASIFNGVFTAEGFNSVALPGYVESDVDDALVSLVAKSLVSAQPTASTTFYRLLDTTRTYAAEKLHVAGDYPAVSLRHARYALMLFGRAESELYSQPAGDYALHLPTLRTALDWAFGQDGDAMLGSQLTIAALPLFFRMSLLDECLGYVTRAIAHLEAHPGLDERNRMKLYAALGWPQMLTTGDSGMSAWKAALEIAESIGDIDHQLRAVWAAWVDRLNNAEPQAALAFADRFQTLAALSTDPTDIILGGRLRAATLHWLGRQAECRSGIEEMLKAYRSPPSSHAIRFQFDQRVTARIILARTLWLQGFADQALSEVQATIDYATALDHNLSLSNVLAEAACSIALWSGQVELARNYIAQLAECTKANSLDVWHTYSACFAGCLALLEGNPRECAEVLEDGLVQLQAAGFTLFQTEFFAMSALAQLRLGNVTAAMDLVDRALIQCANTGERWYLAELHRVKGEVLLGVDRSDQQHLAETEFERSLAIAKEDQTPAWELRTAISLARLRRDQGADGDAAEALSAVYHLFSEGYRTADLQKAEFLLNELSATVLRTG